MTTISHPPLTHAALRQFTGDLDRYYHILNRSVVYTPGIQYLAQSGGAYWLIDAMASHYGSQIMRDAMRRDERLHYQHFWRLDVTDHFGVLTAVADAGEPPFIRQEIPFTDFPLEYIDIWAGFDGARWTLYLPSEH